MKIISFNVNGIRARKHQLKFIIEKYQPDIIGLQETKVSDEDFPVDDIKALGYHVAFHGQKTHYGVALLSRQPPENIIKGFSHDSESTQRRLIIGDFRLTTGKLLRVINGYFPQGENREHPTKFPAKREFYENLQSYLKNTCSPDDFIAVIGDFNISATNYDIGIGNDNAKRWIRTGKCSFLPEEREWFSTLLSWGLIDCFREQQPDTTDAFSWFDYRSRGFDRDPKRGLRIDGVLATRSLFNGCESVTIDYEARAMDKPSDHAPVIAEFNVRE